MNGWANTVNVKIIFVFTYLNCYSVDRMLNLTVGMTNESWPLKQPITNYYQFVITKDPLCPQNGSASTALWWFLLPDLSSSIRAYQMYTWAFVEFKLLAPFMWSAESVCCCRNYHIVKLMKSFQNYINTILDYNFIANLVLLITDFVANK